MAPRIKRTNNSNQSSNRRRSIYLYEKGLNNDNSLLKSYTIPTSQIKYQQQQQVQKMQNDLQIRERIILQNITHFRNINNSNNNYTSDINHIQSAHKSETIHEQILPNDINENYFPEEFPSFVASPIVFKEASFRFNNHHTGAEDSFLIFEDSKAIIEAKDNDDNELIKISSSSSPNKVPGSSDLHDSGHEFQNYYQVTINDNIISSCRDQDLNQSLPFASPVSEKSISRPRIEHEIDFFTIDPEYLRSFEGIWQKTLDFPIRSADPESPDHFELIKRQSSSSSIHKRKKRPNCT